MESREEKGFEGAVNKLDDKLEEVEESFDSLSTYDEQAQSEVETLAALQSSPKILIFVFLVICIIMGFLFVEKRNSTGMTLDFLQLSSLSRHGDVLNCYKDIRALAIQIAGGHQSELGKKISAADDIDVLEDLIRIEEIKIKRKISENSPFDFLEPEPSDPPPSFELKGNKPAEEENKEEQPAKDLEPIAPPDPVEDLAPLPNQEDSL